LDAETALLEYMVGERQSYLWVATRDALRVHRLPPRAELDALVRRVTDAWSRRVQGDDVSASVSRLAAAVLPKGALDGLPTRLAIVADGPLEFLPFAALPVDKRKRLIEAHEIVMLPSASALATQRRVLAGRAPAAKPLAVIADPVFDRTDPRAPACAVAGCGPVVGPAFPRLAGASIEAQAILELTRSATVDAGSHATGIAATRAAVVGGALQGHRTVHIATHGLLDARQPLRTGLMFSRIGADGAAVDGFLGLRDVAELELDADLVVLSACDTALGKEIRGEGLVGLTRGFMHAGARAVLATLWRVSDKGSAEAMRRFYRAHLREGLPPAGALRRAQIELLRDQRYADPYDWAAFTLHGDWRVR
jgi:CHAT domain-containing protein